MNKEQYLKNLETPSGKIDVVIDTDAYNEVDDQYAISYLLRSKEKLNTVALYAAPFFNEKSVSPADGMEKSYNEILKVLDLLDESSMKQLVYKGSTEYLPDEKTPVISDAAKDLAERAKKYSPERPLYVAAIGAITNVASALLIDPDIAENIVIVWLGGHAHHWCDTAGFNVRQDVAAARVVMSSPAPFVQLPGMGVVSAFTVSEPELNYWLKGKNKLCNYLVLRTVEEAEKYAAGTAWTRIIWDVTAVAWLVNENNRFMYSTIMPVRLPGYDLQYEKEIDKIMCYVHHINRDTLMTDLFKKLSQEITL